MSDTEMAVRSMLEAVPRGIYGIRDVWKFSAYLMNGLGGAGERNFRVGPLRNESGSCDSMFRPRACSIERSD